jgi:TRAP-type uncharacterized transport system substrate-binding protein
VANIKGVLSGEFDLGFAQSDTVSRAEGGRSRTSRSPGCARFHRVSELFTLMTRQDAGIRKFEDIKGKRISIGSPGSGTRGRWTS